MRQINEILKRHNLKALKYQKNGNVLIAHTNKGKKVIKKVNDSNIYDYLESRSFDYLPPIIIDDNYEIMDYIENVEIPDEQKMNDLIHILGLLHSKTTFYKEVNEDFFKEKYEQLLKKIEEIKINYENKFSLSESKEYMSPSDYALVRGITIIIDSIEASKNYLDLWYEESKEQTKERFSVVHNNLELNHLIEGNTPYLVSFEQAKTDEAIYDLCHLYRNYALDFDFLELLKSYQKIYPLKKREMDLFFSLITLPNNYLEANELEKTQNISKELDYLYKTNKFINSYYVDQTKSDETN